MYVYILSEILSQIILNLMYVKCFNVLYLCTHWRMGEIDTSTAARIIGGSAIR
jgi:hypothetical protein